MGAGSPCNPFLMTTKSTASLALARKNLSARIVVAQREADVAKKAAKSAKAALRDAKKNAKAAKRHAKKLRKVAKALKAEFVALAPKRPAARKSGVKRKAVALAAPAPVATPVPEDVLPPGPTLSSTEANPVPAQ